MAWTYLVWLGLLYLVAWPGLDYLDYLDYFLAWTLASVLYLISDRDASDVCRCFCSWLDDNSLRGFWDLGESRNKKKWNGVEWNCPSHYCKLANGTFSGGCQETPNGEFPGVPNKKGDLKPLAQLWEPTKLNLTAESVKLGRERTLLLGESLRVIGKDPLEIDVRANKARAMWSSIHYSHEVDGSLVVSSVGNNSHGQLFQYDVPEKIVDFEVGSEHGILLTESGKVYAWGWGEHGNCGERKDDSVTFNFLNLIYNGTSKVTKMACGLATTWLVVE